MEQARYWMWAKRKQPDSNYGDSWEEQAFAEDSAGLLGGSVWPPRSYSCSFCRREFRSAQALGGHMNVHRRDRARMKQLSPIPAATHEVVVPQNHALNTCTSFHDSPYSSSQITTFLYNINPNPNPELCDTSRLVRVSSPPCNKTSTLSFVSPVVQTKDVDNNNIDSSQPPSWSSVVAEKRNRDLNVGRVEKEDCVTQDLSISLNLIFCAQTKTKTSKDEEVECCKRRRIEANNALSSLPKLGAVEELDLELRLGDAPKVK